MKPILKCIAEAYNARYSDLKNICFLFPNKRCGVFLKNYLEELKIPSKKLPFIKTISEFTSDLSNLEEAGKIEAIFLLFNCYKRIMTKNEGLDPESIEFESFRSWGETVISDFNTVDQNLVDPSEIFKNIKNYREISTNFLTDNQKEVLKEYFGYVDFSDSDSFWKNFQNLENISAIKNRFINLWQILAELHDVFLQSLEKKQKSTTGGIYRRSVERLMEKGRELLPYKKIVVFGFNALNGAERKLFSLLKEFKGYQSFDDFADFIWDATGPVLSDPDNPSARFITSNKKHFPAPDWILEKLKESDNPYFPDIRIISSPSNTIQSKIAGEVLRDYKSNKQESAPYSEIVLVVPDESLLVNTLYSIPEEFQDINLTMGYPFRQTGVASFMSILRRVYSTMRQSKGQILFFNKDLRLLLSHPYASQIFSAKEIESIFDYISLYHKITITFEEIKDKLPEADPLFLLPLKNSDSKEVFNYLDVLFEYLINNFKQKEEGNLEAFELCHIKEYYRHIKILETSMEEYGISMKPINIFFMIERLVASVKIGFEGIPLHGLQIMGTLETRGLDFKDVVIVSMNEGLMPRRSRAKSFIPENIRKGYGLPPSRYSEDIFAYYFYRLISRADKATLIYDSRIGGGLKRGGISRYLLQLKHFGDNIKISEENYNFHLKATHTHVCDMPKTEEIKDLIKFYQSSDGVKRKNLSASSLNTYRECQVKFCLKYLFNLNPDPELGDFLDAITIGNILHDVMMRLYLDDKSQRKLLKNPVTISSGMIKEMINNKDLIYSLIRRKINKDFYRYDNSDLDKPLPEASAIVAEQLLEQVLAILEYDMKLAPFRLYGCEISEKMELTLSSGRKVNFSFAIDRLDEILVEGKPRLRIVDYKTGMRKREANSLEEVLKGDYRSEQIFQLFIYALLLQYHDVPGKQDVLTEIYFVPDLIAETGGLPKIGKQPVKSYKEFASEFEKGVFEMIEGLFENDSFSCSSNPNDCCHCDFRKVCEKIID